MRAADIVNQLAVRLPALVDDFTDQLAVNSLTRSGTTVTVTTAAAHNLAVNQQVNITGAQTPINISSLTRVGIVGTLITDADHDITENAGFDVQISGATEAEFNGTFTLLSVPNRRTITFQMVDSGATTATGSPLLLNGSNVFQSYNGLRRVTATPTTTTFEYEVTDTTLFTPASGTIVVKTSPRITASVSFERIAAFYTKQSIDDAYLIVVLGDAIANKNRNIDTDATDNIQRGHYFNQKLIQGVSLFLLIPTSAQIAARAARDRAEELLSPICQSILSAKFPSLVENTNNPLMLSSHGFQDYNGAVYVHQYTFETTLQLGPSDIFEPDDDVAFRDIDLTMGLDVGTETFNTLIDLDDVPL